MDITCAHCGEPWDVYGLKHDGADYLTDGQATQLGVSADFAGAQAGDKDAAARASKAVYYAVLSGKGCPGSDCGFSHDGDGPHRETQYRELVLDGVTDDDPMEFL